MMIKNSVHKKKDAGISDSEIPDIFEAAETNDLESLKIALEYYDINSRDAIGMTPLHYAASTLAMDTARHLLDNECDATLADKFQRTAATLAYECWEGLAEEMVQILEPHCFPNPPE